MELLLGIEKTIIIGPLVGDSGIERVADLTYDKVAVTLRKNGGEGEVKTLTAVTWVGDGYGYYRLLLSPADIDTIGEVSIDVRSLDVPILAYEERHSVVKSLAPTEVEPTEYDGALITLTEAKDVIRIYSPLINALVGNLIAGAEEHIARVTGSPLTVTEFTEYLDGGFNSLRPVCWPIVAVTSITDMTCDSLMTGYRVAPKGIRYLYQGCPAPWPAGCERIKVIYTAGYNNGNGLVKPEGSISAPAGLKSIALELVHRAYELRGGQTGHSGAGYSVSWDTLTDGEVETKLSRYCDERLG